MLELRPFVEAVQQADRSDPEWASLIVELEELRVSTFAQELGRGGVSAKKLAARLDRLRR